MSHGGERRRQTQQSKLGSFKISIKEKNPWRVGFPNGSGHQGQEKQ